MLRYLTGFLHHAVGCGVSSVVAAVAAVVAVAAAAAALGDHSGARLLHLSHPRAARYLLLEPPAFPVLSLCLACALLYDSLSPEGTHGPGRQVLVKQLNLVCVYTASAALLVADMCCALSCRRRTSGLSSR